MWVNSDLCCKKIWLSNGLLQYILTGVFPKDSVDKMSKDRLERMVTRLIIATTDIFARKKSENDSNRRCRPKWWPDDVVFHYPIEELRDRPESHSMKWRSILRYLIATCSDFYKHDRFFVSFAPNLNSPKSAPRKVLAPTQEKENFDSRQDRRRKRKLSEETNCISENKKPKSIRNNTRSCKITEKKSILENNCLSRNAVVPLRDILLEIPSEKQITEEVKKDDFLSYFKLGQPNQEHKKTIIPIKRNCIRLCAVPNIPFSSDIGKIIMKRENLHIPVEVHLKRIDRIEWYMKTSNCSSKISDRSYEVVYDGESDIPCHNYTFYKRQFHQKSRSIKEGLLHSILKPAVVKLKRSKS